MNKVYMEHRTEGTDFIDDIVDYHDIELQAVIKTKTSMRF